MKIPICKSARLLYSLVVAIVLGMGLSLNAQAQTCSGAIDLSRDIPGDVLFHDQLPEIVRVTLRPRQGGGSDPLTVEQVRYALACADNEDTIPCEHGNDLRPGGTDPSDPDDLPVAFAGNVGGTCGATEGEPNSDDPAGVINFDVDPIVVGEEGCTVEFDVEVRDIGTDETPYLLSAAAEHDGTCEDTGLSGSASGTLIIQILDPEITVTKTGPDLVKAGDEVCYDIQYDDVGGTPVGNCTGDDDVLGDLDSFEDGVSKQFCRISSPDDDNPLVNTATITCDILNATGTLVEIEDGISEFDTHSVEQIDPEISVFKTGPDSAKAGDMIEYTIGFENTGVGELENCTGNDDVLGDLGSFEAGVPRTFGYTVETDDPNPLVNTATITCDVVGFDNQASDSDDHSVDIVSPGVELTKQCDPDPVLVGDTIEWTISVTNTGNVDLDCLVNDPEAGVVDAQLSLAPNDSEAINESRIVVEDDYPLLSNTASVECDIAGFDNTVGDEDTADCEVEIPGEEICRTPGFWGTHAGEEHRRSSNLTQMVIDAAGGELSVCGQVIDNTDVGNVNSAVEAMCVRIEGEQQRQLARQLTAMALNCVVSGGDADCAGTSVEDLFADANAACIAGGGGPELGPWIELVDEFNNDPECGERNLDESTDIFDGVDPLPGPAGSARACRDANGNGIKVVPAL